MRRPSLPSPKSGPARACRLLFKSCPAPIVYPGPSPGVRPYGLSALISMDQSRSIDPTTVSEPSTTELPSLMTSVQDTLERRQYLIRIFRKIIRFATSI